MLERSRATIIINMNGCCQDNLGKGDRELMGMIDPLMECHLREKAGCVPFPGYKKAIALIQKALQ